MVNPQLHDISQIDVMPHPAPGTVTSPEQEGKLAKLISNPKHRQSMLDTFSGNVSVEQAGPGGMVGYRQFGGKVDTWGRFLTDKIGATREETAVLPEWGNPMEFEAGMRYPEGTGFVKGTTASQKAKTGEVLAGGGKQMFLPDTSGGLLESLRPTEEGLKKYSERDLRYGGYI
jgi:hypothetical protein